MKKHFGYVDSFVIPVPRKNLAAYKKMARLSAKVWKEHGALDYTECRADDVKPGKVTSFPQSVKLKRNEVVFVGFATYRSKRERDRVMKEVMNDPRLAGMMDPNSLPFDGRRMFFGGFKPVVAA